MNGIPMSRNHSFPHACSSKSGNSRCQSSACRLRVCNTTATPLSGPDFAAALCYRRDFEGAIFGGPTFGHDSGRPVDHTKQAHRSSRMADIWRHRASNSLRGRHVYRISRQSGEVDRPHGYHIDVYESGDSQFARHHRLWYPVPRRYRHFRRFSRHSTTSFRCYSHSNFQQCDKQQIRRFLQIPTL